MKRENDHATCPMDGFLRIISGPWTTYILWVLSNEGPVRFGELKRIIPGISSRMLTERLRMLEENELVSRNYKPTIPPEVSYDLTDRGKKMRSVLRQLNDIAVELGMAEPCQGTKIVVPSKKSPGRPRRDAEIPAE